MRWDGEATGGHPNPGFRGRFNVEATGQGISFYEDAYYTTWPNKITDRQVKVNGYLDSLEPFEEMAQFLAARGHHGVDVGQRGFAARCYENAHRRDPTRPAYRYWFMQAAAGTDYQPITPMLRQTMAMERSIHQPSGYEPGQAT